MGKNKLQKFADLNVFENVFQYVYKYHDINDDLSLKGRWRDYFKNDNPIVLELGCGKGEYTVSLARKNPHINYIGIDIKGCRMWTGAKMAREEGLPNAAFLRTEIGLLDKCFAANEVAEIWITFPDPQMKKVNKRLTSTRFMGLYRQFLAPQGLIHLKTDSPFLFTYTQYMIKENELPLLCMIDDIHALENVDSILKITTYYESQWIARGLTIKYLQWQLTDKEPLIEPDVEIEEDSYRSFNRERRSNLTKQES